MLLDPLAAAVLVLALAEVLSGLFVDVAVDVPLVGDGDLVFSFVRSRDLSFSFSFSLGEDRAEEVVGVLELEVLVLLELLEVVEVLEVEEVEEVEEALLVLALLERPVGVGVVDLVLEREPVEERAGEGAGTGG